MAFASKINTVGRFGNQLFLAAVTYAHSIKMGEYSFFPEWKYKSQFTNFERLTRLTNHSRWQVYKEPHFHYAPVPIRKDLDLQGYFQSELYFKDYEIQILELFHQDIKQLENTCAIHIRRTDYLLTKVHLLCSIDYYLRAIELIKKINPKIQFIVFSDDIKWCKEQEIFKGFEFSEGSEMEDFKLMRSCTHFIIANSSFSWWAAYLSESPDKTVIAPYHWLAEHYANDKNTVPDKWIIIKSNQS